MQTLPLPFANMRVESFHCYPLVAAMPFCSKGSPEWVRQVKLVGRNQYTEKARLGRRRREESPHQPFLSYRVPAVIGKRKRGERGRGFTIV